MELILVVDDAVLLLRSIEIILKANGYEVIKASNGQEAIERLDEEWITNQRLPDLILSDLGMPVMSGLQLFSALQANPRYHSIPFVAITGGNFPPSSYKDLNFQAVILKPFKLEELLGPLRRLAKKGN